MEKLTTILETAKQRALEKHLPYAGALTPKEAQQVLQLTSNAKLVDVRSSAEIDLVGRIPLASHIEWEFYPGWTANPDFLTQLSVQIDKEKLIMFICRSGGRSHHAAVAATQLGYAECYNVLEGFEGEAKPQTKQRGKINGWKVAGLPWVNS